MLIIIIETYKCFIKYKITWKDYKQKWGIYKKKIKKVDCILHAVSCCEVMIYDQLLKYWRKKKFFNYCSYSYRIFINKKYTPYCVIKPFDTFLTMLILLIRTQPKIIIVAENDLWPFYIGLAKCMNIKIYLINYRTKSYIRDLYHSIIATKIYNKNSVGNLKILSTDIPMESLKQYDTIIISCANANEFNLHLKYIKEILKINRNVKIIYVPRHLDWLKQFEKNMDLNYYLLFKDRELDINVLFKKYDIIVVWSFGILGHLYKFSKICLMGDTFNDIGGHNILEPAINNNIILLGP